MTVAYSQRNTPLAAKSGNAYGTAVALAFDFTGMGALAEGSAYIYQGATRPVLVKSGTINQVTANGIPGRQSSNGAVYNYSNATDYGLQVGTGDFTIGVVLSTGASLPTATRNTQVMITNASDAPILQIILNEATSGWWFQATGLGLTGGASTVYGVDTSLIFWVRRVGGQVSAWTQVVGTTTLTNRYAAVANSTDFNSTAASKIRVAYNASGGAVTSVINNVRFWRVGYSDADLQTIGADWWALDDNSAPTDGLAITTPSTGGTIATTTIVSGTYTGNAPTGVQVQHGAAAWVTGTGFTASAGTWSASFVLTAAASAALRARYANNTAVVSAAVANITVAANSIAFTTPPTTTNGAVNHRFFQRDGSNQSSVRITGTYAGSPGSIQYSFNGSAWATLVASPSGGTFDATVTLQGPAMGALSVRFSSDNSVSQSITVAVGDVWITAGQSNPAGRALNYVAATVPGAHPAWYAGKFGKNHVWAPHVEASGTPLSDNTGIVWSVQTDGSPLGSFAGALATIAMASGVPIAFVPCAVGSTILSTHWAVPATINDTTTLFGAMVAAAQMIGAHKGVIWYEGESEANGAGSPGTFQADLNNRVDTWFANIGTPWLLVNICSTGNSGGSGYATVRAAIAAVAASNAHVIGVADMENPSPAFTGSIHYSTVTEVNTVAARIASALGYSGAVTKTVSIALTTNGSTAAANLSGLRWSFFDQATPDLFTAPSAKGSGETTDGSGLLVVDVSASSLAAGQTGWLIVTDSDGTTTQNPSARAFSGPAVVA